MSAFSLLSVGIDCFLSRSLSPFSFFATNTLVLYRQVSCVRYGCLFVSASVFCRPLSHRFRPGKGQHGRGIRQEPQQGACPTRDCCEGEDFVFFVVGLPVCVSERLCSWEHFFRFVLRRLQTSLNLFLSKSFFFSSIRSHARPVKR